KKTGYYLMDADIKTDLLDYDLVKSTVYLDDENNIYKVINNECTNTYYNKDGKELKGFLTKRIDVNELTNKIFKDILIGNAFEYNKKDNNEIDRCVYTTNAYKKILISKIDKKMYIIHKIINTEYKNKILTADVSIDELKYYCNQLKIFL